MQFKSIKLTALKRRPLLIGGVIVAVLALLYWAFQPTPVLVDVAAVRRGPLAVTVTEEGFTRVAKRYLISAPASGELERIELEPGDAVSAGQLLATVQPPVSGLLDARGRAQAEAQLAGAEANLNRSRALLEAEQARLALAASAWQRAKSVAADGLLAAEQLERAQTELAQGRAGSAAAEQALIMAERQRDAARAALERTQVAAGDQVEVHSPIDGVVLKRLRESAGAVALGEALLELGDPATLEVQTDLLTDQAVQIKPGMRVSLARWGGEVPIAGAVERVEPAGFTKYSALGVEEQRVWVITRLDPNGPWRGRLGDGYRVETTFYLLEQEDVLQVPVSALFREGDNWFVYLADAGRALKRQVVPGSASGLWRAVASGLDADAVVVTHPGERLRDGSAIDVRGQ